MLLYAFSMYYGEIENKNQTFTCKLGWHTTTLARLSAITSNFQK
jgi:hypothetical protein